MVAKTLYGFEEILAGELRALGAGKVRTGVRCAFFEGDLGFMYKANLNLRTALRVLMPIRDFRIHRPEALYDLIRETDWTRYLTPEMTFVVDTVLQSDLYSHSLFVSQKVKDAIVDQIREKTGGRPSVSVARPDLRIHLHIQGQNAHLSLDSSGDSLHQRGYRTITNKAPLNEVLAAGMLLLSGWRGQCDLLDPMCGSGTLLIEGAMIACNIPAGINRRHFGFQSWRDYDPALFKVIYDASIKKVRDFRFRIQGYDKAPSAIVKARENVKNANLEDYIHLEQTDFFKTEKQSDYPLHLVCNPPYGQRLTVDPVHFYSRVGDTLKQHYPGTVAWFLLGDPEHVKHVGLRASRKIKLYNGSIETRLARFDIYSGSKKAKYQDV
ncbi:THUMP domain-containing protein [Robiginitalea sp. M366]|uniref:THUMP domain-containing class I SAM-dependent RNA methyltransferase n=1 Tax=Robiginitalea aestuariiviva TaxID=3036903 RepID=UPI00240CFF95|nr:THUMP domain-containing protein [Robiginitalea aestuariiviva]MDG1573167.1 THUMP domain-containing protein [Robiginitalea aestuariiviva]